MSLKSHRDPADSRSCISVKVGMTLLCPYSPVAMVAWMLDHDTDSY
jgi:hypothetical protein